MHKKLAQAIACTLSVTLMFSVAVVNQSDDAATTTSVTYEYAEAASPYAGISYSMASTLDTSVSEDIVLSETVTSTVAATEEAIASGATNEEVAETTVATAFATSDFSNIGIATVDDYVNVRSEANADSDSVGKLHSGDAAIVLSESEDGWYQVISGSFTGYVSSDYLSVGDEETISDAGTLTATIGTETLKVRTDAAEDASVLTLVAGEDEYVVVDDSVDGWVQIKTADGEGYVSSDYVDVTYDFSYGESAEEEAARLEAEEAAKAASKSSSSRTYANDAATSYKAASGSDGASVVSYACQFVGNPYVAAGTSLTNGADCSGFVMSVYAAFGVSLPHSSSAMRSCGTGVDVSSMQAGDIVCYSGHVGIYAGNGMIVNALNSRNGITYTDVNYKSIICVRRIFN